MSRVLTPISPSLDLVFKAIMGDPAQVREAAHPRRVVAKVRSHVPAGP